MSTSSRLMALRTALQFMGLSELDRGPKPFAKTVINLADMDGVKLSKKDIDAIWGDIFSDDPNSPCVLEFGKFLRRWDALRDTQWDAGTQAHTDLRRTCIYELLELDEGIRGKIAEIIPVAGNLDSPTVIAEEHEPWYTPEVRARRHFYWGAYENYLRDVSRWEEESINKLDEASTLVVERLSNPERQEIFATKGLVVGYVQSGKTANFTAVTAKAADAGYRLIIILAGTLNVLREQTQRRIDKELIGQEIIERQHRPHDYSTSQDWSEFISHGDLPSTLGAFDWNRLTGEDDDYQRLKRGIEALEFDVKTKGRRFNDPINLHHWPARIVVMKKLPSIINKLNDDLDLLRTELEEVPALIIDDESDQASVNTRAPTADEEKRRTSTNKAIVRLIRALPRAQYVGYTATPFANVFVDPTDTEDLFPKDYIVSLHRPKGYMGVSDFFDLADDGLDLSDEEKPNGFESNERAYLRDVYGDDDEDSNLPEAIELFILSGAVKLYRHHQGISVSIKHHTMLVHRSVRKTDHEDDYNLVNEIYDGLGVGSKRFYNRLHALWNHDVKPVSSCKLPELPMPDRFADLKPFIDKCLSKIRQSGHPVRVVNGDKKYEKLMPNFDRDSIWGVLVGGTKLSRGYTVEGLTISYYRRRIKQADTLMQVGRWFGFRRGYSDLVRVYLGREEPDGRGRSFDLKEAFKSICRDEEMFRKELRKYTDKDIQPPILPRDIPPLVPSHMLRPTSPNKMYNVDVKYQNFSGEWKERVHTTNKIESRKNNASLIHNLIPEVELEQVQFGYSDMDNGKDVRWKGYVITISHSEMLGFLEKYRWVDDKKLMQRELDFMKGSGDEDPEIDSWLIIFPQKSTNSDLCWNTRLDLSVFRRARVVSGAFRVFSESRHRLVARYLAGVVNLENPTDDLTNMCQPKTGVMMCYPTVDNDYEVSGAGSTVPDNDITIGFGIQFPNNTITTPIRFGVVDSTNADALIVSN